ncbi:MAG: hypothetical protein J5858_13120 [Lentisphaeria bacterium]|nr:hypothetical protein [Lentisphaeria bacterium]
MRRTAGENQFWYRFLPWIAGAAALFSASAQMFRMLWFDEVLTVDLLMKLPFFRIYFAYEIPNNHIVFTLLEKLWFGAVSSCIGFSYYYFRIIPMLCGAAAIFLLTRLLIHKSGLAAGILIPAVFAVSSVFAVYATAIRGYMTGFLLTVLAMRCAENIIKTARKRDYPFYFLLSVFAVGTTPTNLAALAGIMLYFLPAGMRHGRNGIRKLIFLAVAPVFALMLFYFPIREKFFGCIRLGEGWNSTASAIYTFYTGALFPLAGLLVFCIAGMVYVWWKIPRLRWNCICGLLIVLMPLGAYLVMRVPPFPRVFFPLLAVWLVLAAHALNAFFRLFRNRKTAVWAVFLLQGIFCAVFFQDRAQKAGDFLYGSDGRADDYIAPYYARTSFTPNLLLEYLRRKYRQEGDFRVFAAFNADPPSLFFAGNILDFPEGILLTDTLNRPKTVRLQDYPGPKYLICGSRGELEMMLNRFGFRSAVPEKQFGIQCLYRVEE